MRVVPATIVELLGKNLLQRYREDLRAGLTRVHRGTMRRHSVYTMECRHVPSDEILASIFQYFGFRLDPIGKMPKRQSKGGLYEAVVFMRW